jgi:hypothetical protein
MRTAAVRAARRRDGRAFARLALGIGGATKDATIIVSACASTGSASVIA